MLISFPTLDIAGAIQVLERRDLDNAQAPDSPPIWGQLEGVPFIRVLGQAAFWKAESENRAGQQMDDLLASAHGQGLEFQYLVVGQPREVAFFVGMAGADAEPVLRTALTAAFPGIWLAERAENSLGRILQGAGMFGYRGRLTGIPTRKGNASPRPANRGGQGREQPHRQEGASTDSLAGQQIERIVRGLAGQGWGLWVKASPYPLPQVTADAYACLDTIAAAASQTKRQVQQLNQTMQQVDGRTQASSSESVSGEIVNRQAEYAVMLLERNLQRLDEAKAVGMWQVEAHFFSPKPDTLVRAESLVRAVFAGPDSVPQPLRVVACGPTSISSQKFATLLTSIELGTLAQLPREESPGYRITDYARFDTHLEGSVAPAVEIGPVLDGNRETGRSYAVPVVDLAKHGLVVGMTGSGKTTTILALLDKLWQGGKGTPFLVVESAKAEYRRLRGPIPDLRVYTLGDETVAPLRLNPFEFEIEDEKHRIHVQTHIDYLKSVFNAAFILYAPMPYVLDTCLHEIYTDRGWDLTTGLNRRLPKALLADTLQWPAFPTLTDLYRKIDEVTERLGYEERIEMDVKAGLKARVGSLRLGSKGLMLDTEHGVPMKELLSHPTILELERIGNDDEKAFIIGLMMTRVCEYRRVQASSATSLPEFQHMVVVEEAHRLLKNVPTEVETEAANTKGQAVETFTNMLAEIRAYGQGVLIAEQIPCKLTPDAIKNTNLKVVHRLVAADDRKALASAMNMEEAQERFLVTLPPGRAVVYAEPADHPFLIGVANYKKQLPERITDDAVREGMYRLVSGPRYDPVADYGVYFPPVSGKVDTAIHDFGLLLLARREFPEMWAGLMLRLIRDPNQASELLAPFLRLAAAAAGEADKPRQRQIIKAAFLHAINDSLHQRGRHYNWLYPQVEKMRLALCTGLMSLIGEDQPNALATLSQFVTDYRELSTVSEGPFPGCDPCRVRCWLRHDAGVAASDKALRREIVETINQYADGPDLWAELSKVVQHAVTRLAGPLSASDAAALSVCVSAQAAAALAFSPAMQRLITENLVGIL